VKRSRCDLWLTDNPGRANPACPFIEELNGLLFSPCKLWRARHRPKKRVLTTGAAPTMQANPCRLITSSKELASEKFALAGHRYVVPRVTTHNILKSLPEMSKGIAKKTSFL